MRFRCPHCLTLSTVRTSECLNPLESTLYLQCPNLRCSHSWVVLAQVTHTLSPSGTPNPEVHIPISSRIGLPPKPADQKGFPFVYAELKAKGKRTRASRELP